MCELYFLSSLNLGGERPALMVPCLPMHRSDVAMVSSLTAFIPLLLLLLSTHACSAQRLSLPPLWSFSADLSFPSSSPSSLNSYTGVAPFSLFVPILSSSSFSSGSKGFSFGFLSLFQTPSSPPSGILLAICLGFSSNGALHSKPPFLLPVWTSNTTAPLQQPSQQELVNLEVDNSRQLSLIDGDGTVMWTLSNVGSMELQSNGNLVIFNTSNQTIWQSFDHPTDTLVQGQRLALGMELTSSNNMYKVLMQAGGLLYYEVSAYPIPLAYGIYSANVTVNDYYETMVAAFTLDRHAPVNLTAALASPKCDNFNESQAFTLVEQNVITVQDACGNIYKVPSNNTVDLYRLDTDGSVRDYYLHELADSSYVVTSIESDNKPCYTPNVCGAYGICFVSNKFGNTVLHQCRCPSPEDNANLSNAFTTIDISNPSEGCRRAVALECGQASSQLLVEMKEVAFMSMLPIFERTWEESTMSLEDCKAACSLNCSCSGFFYHINSSFCLPFGDTTPLSNVSFLSLPSDEHIAFIKIQSAVARSKTSAVIIGVAVILPVLVILLVVLAVYWRWKYNMDPELKLAEEELMGVMPMLPTRYSYQELRRFTQGFTRKLGSGGFGSVYEGTLPDGRRVAVKKLELMSHGQKEFLAEIATIGGIKHVNIVNLYGFCLERQYRLLVYEYMENRSLDSWLFCKGEDQHRPVLSWETRFNIALGTARGLAYLHEECPKPILHFDVKPQNILLDGSLNAKLADFGLAKLVAREQSSVMTVVRGTPGYIAPEWVSQSIVSKKCDVYSFGMVLLELVSGRKNVQMDLMGSEEYYFPKWAAKKMRKGNFIDLIDKRLDAAMLPVKDVDGGTDESIVEQVEKVVQVALWCIHENPEMRPSMTVVCGMLEGGIALPNDIPEVATSEMPAYKVSSSGSIKYVESSSLQGR